MDNCMFSTGAIAHKRLQKDQCVQTAFLPRLWSSLQFLHIFYCTRKFLFESFLFLETTMFFLHFNPKGCACTSIPPRVDCLTFLAFRIWLCKCTSTYIHYLFNTLNGVSRNVPKEPTLEQYEDYFQSQIALFQATVVSRIFSYFYIYFPLGIIKQHPLVTQQLRE